MKRRTTGAERTGSEDDIFAAGLRSCWWSHWGMARSQLCSCLQSTRKLTHNCGSASWAVSSPKCEHINIDVTRLEGLIWPPLWVAQVLMKLVTVAQPTTINLKGLHRNILMGLVRPLWAHQRTSSSSCSVLIDNWQVAVSQDDTAYVDSHQ